MRKLILSMMTSLDGGTARPDGDLGWFRSDPDLEAELIGVLRRVDGMFFGRVAYQELAAFWPTAGKDDADDAPGGFTSRESRLESARLMNTIPKLVVSRTLERLDWGPGRVVNGDLAGTVTAMKREPGRDLVLFAGATVAAAFLNLDLFDEIRLYVHPIVLGPGKRLFDAIRAEHPLTLSRATPFPSGVVLLNYTRESATTVP